MVPTPSGKGVILRKNKATLLTRTCLPFRSNHHNNVEQILDIGSGTGLLAIIGAKLWKSKALAVDNDNNAVIAAKTNAKNNNVSTYVTSKFNDVVKSPVKITTNSKFDLITAFHVIEHVKNPIAILKDLFSYLNENGLLVLEVPNIECVV